MSTEVQDVLDVLVPPEVVDVHVYTPTSVGAQVPVFWVPGLLRGHEVTVWEGDLTDDERRWIDAAATILVHGHGYVRHPLCKDEFALLLTTRRPSHTAWQPRLRRR